MSDININGIPNLGFAGAGGGYFGGNAGLGLPAIGAVGDFGASKFSQPLYNNIFGNFGQQTDYYSGLGAAYGRATGGFGAPGSNPGWQAPAPAGGGANSDIPAALLSQMSPSDIATFRAATGGGGGVSTPAYESRVQSMGLGSGYPGGFPGGYFDPSIYQPSARPVEDVNSWFNQATGGGGGNPYPLGGYGGFDPFTPGYGGQGAGYTGGGGGWGQAPQLPDIQRLLGYNPATSAQFAPQPSQNASPFFGAFANFPNSATPSQYTYQPYTNAQGQTFQPNMPQGFAPLYGVDTPQGALPGWTNPFGENSQAGG